MSLLEKRNNIILANGIIVLIDEEDYAILSKHKWHASGKPAYAARKETTKRIYMHRILMGAKEGEYIDHINGDRLDNRRSNLRKCTTVENCRNSKLSVRNKTGIKGVFLYTANKEPCYRAYIRVGGKLMGLGFYNTIEEAAKVRIEAEIKYFKEFRRELT